MKTTEEGTLNQLMGDPAVDTTTGLVNRQRHSVGMIVVMATDATQRTDTLRCHLVAVIGLTVVDVEIFSQMDVTHLVRSHLTLERRECVKDRLPGRGLCLTTQDELVMVADTGMQVVTAGQTRSPLQAML